MIQTRDKRMAAGSRQATKGRLQAIDAAQGRRNANRAVGVGPERKVHQPCGHGGGRTAGRAARNAREVVRVTRRAVVAVFGGKAVGVGIHVHHAGQQPARAAQLAHREAVSGCGRALAEQLGPGEGGMAGNVEQVLHRVGHARQRREGALLAPQGIDVSGLGEHALFRHRGPGIDLRVNARNRLQRLAGDVAGAQLACAERLLNVADTHLV